PPLRVRCWTSVDPGGPAVYLGGSSDLNHLSGPGIHRLDQIRHQLFGPVPRRMVPEGALPCSEADLTPLLRREGSQISNHLIPRVRDQNLGAGLEELIQSFPRIRDNGHAASSSLK